MASPNDMMRAWLGAVFLCLAGIVVILNLPNGDAAASNSKRFEDAIRNLDPVPDILVLGSSLSLMAFPSQLHVDAASGSDAPTLRGTRFAAPCARPEELARLLEAAIGRGVSIILLEINQFLYDPVVCQPETDIRNLLRDFVTVLRWRIKWAIFGVDSALAEAARDPPVLGKIYDGHESQRDFHGRITLRSPQILDVLETGLAAGRQKGLAVVLVAFPRSETASRFLGAAFNAALDSRLADVRNRFANVVWEPARFWPNRYFSDRAHMNQAGRERILAELQDMLGEAR
jgi:hypothetical protein